MNSSTGLYDFVLKNENIGSNFIFSYYINCYFSAPGFYWHFQQEGNWFLLASKTTIWPELYEKDFPLDVKPDRGGEIILTTVQFISQLFSQ